MSAATVGRRFLVFGLLFGGAMALVIWQAGGVEVPETTRPSPDDVERARPPDGEVVPIDAGAAMGRGRGVRVTRDAVEVVDGQPVPYRAFEAAWEHQTPLPGGTLDERRIHTTDFTALVFHRRPTVEEPRPPAVEGPDTTRLQAAEAELTMRQGAAFRAQLAGDVEVVRHAVDHDLVLRTDALDIERSEGARGADELHATSASRVRMEGAGTDVAGTGLEADLGRSERSDAPPARVVLLADVAGSLLARPGALTSQGGDETADVVPATFSCSGAAELVEQRAPTRRQTSTWLLLLQDDVVVRQEPVEMRCATLEVEFRRTARGRRPIEILRMVADGDVVVTGTDEVTGDAWSMRAARSTTRRDAKGGYDVDLEGGTLLAFDGTLRGRTEDGASRGRVEIRCSGTATLHTDPEPTRPGTPVRTQITFRDDVVARQWNEQGTLETEIRAPVVTLAGTRGTTAEGRLDPETLTARGTPEQRVHVRRETLNAQANALTWRVLREADIEKLLLGGRPAVRLEGGPGIGLLGPVDADTPAVVHLDAEERVEITWRHTPAAELELAPGEPYVTAIARQDVVVRRLVGERESYRLEARSLDATLDADLQPTHFRAYGDVVLDGDGDRPGGRHVRMTGDRLAADRVAGEDNDWVSADVFVFGQEGALATALITEPSDAPDEPPTQHVVQAEQLRYQEGGTLVTAKRNAEILLDRAVRAVGGDRADVHVRGRELRAHLRPPEPGASGAPEVLRLEGEGGVSLATAGYRINGQTMSYDRVSGIAMARGRPARGILRDPARGEDSELESYVASEEIRVEFDPTEKTPGRPRRVTCQGGTMRYYQPTEPGAPDGRPERVTLRAEGPIEVLGDRATAEREVEMIWEAQPPGGTWRRDARLLCERVELDFDTTATGPARDRIRRAVAVGSRSRAAQLFSPRVDATADRVESSGPWIDLLSPWGRRVHVVQRDPEQSFTCDKGRYNYVTQEFEATRARAE